MLNATFNAVATATFGVAGHYVISLSLNSAPTLALKEPYRLPRYRLRSDEAHRSQPSEHFSVKIDAFLIPVQGTLLRAILLSSFQKRTAYRYFLATVTFAEPQSIVASIALASTQNE